MPKDQKSFGATIARTDIANDIMHRIETFTMTRIVRIGTRRSVITVPSLPIDQKRALEKFTADLRREVEALRLEIKAEELRSNQFDPGHSNYPLKARTWSERICNLMMTIETLERRIN